VAESEIIARILDAAGSVFREHGVAKSRMGHVAAAAECSRATLYRYYPTKETLVAAFAMRELEDMSRRVLGRIESERRLGDRLIEAIALAIEATRETPAIRPFLEPESHELTVSIPTQVFPMGPALLAMLVSVVASHDGSERLRPELPPSEMLEWIVRLVLSLALVPGPARTAAQLRAFIGGLVRPAFVTPA
jgi:AcrR family transcriptional regulator